MAYVKNIIDICHKLSYNKSTEGGASLELKEFFPVWRDLTPTQQEQLAGGASKRTVQLSSTAAVWIVPA